MKLYIIKNFASSLKDCGETVFVCPNNEMTKDELFQMVKDNAGDMYECGACPYAMIGEVGFGFYCPVEEIQWFKWDKKTEHYIEIERPVDDMFCFLI